MSTGDCCQCCCCCIACFSICGHSSGNYGWCNCGNAGGSFGKWFRRMVHWKEERGDEYYAAQVQREMLSQQGPGTQQVQPGVSPQMQMHTKGHGSWDARQSRSGSETATLVSSSSSHAHHKSLSDASRETEKKSQPHTRMPSSNTYGAHLAAVPPAVIHNNRYSEYQGGQDGEESSGLVFDAQGNPVAVRDPKLFR